LDVSELHLDALEVAAIDAIVGGGRIRRAVAGFDIIVRRIAVVKTIGENLVDVLVSPVRGRRVMLGSRGRGDADQKGDEKNPHDKRRAPQGVKFSRATNGRVNNGAQTSSVANMATWRLKSIYSNLVKHILLPAVTSTKRAGRPLSVFGHCT